MRLIPTHGLLKNNVESDCRYTILDKLGQGTFGQVVLCKEEVLGAEPSRAMVAIKVIKNHPAYFKRVAPCPYNTLRCDVD